jgi:hypothetical protein
MENLKFTPERVEMFRAKVAKTCPRNFEDVVKYFERECGMRRSRAIFAARATRGDLYNAFHAALHHQRL